MTAREAVIQAQLELGMSREEAELRAKFSEGIIPGASDTNRSPVQRGLEREFIEFLKELYRSMDRNPGVWDKALAEVLGEQAQKN